MEEKSKIYDYLTGLPRKQADEYFGKMKLDYEQKINTLSNKIQNYAQETERINRRAEALQREKANRIYSSDFVDIALSRIKQVEDIMNGFARQEVTSISAASRQKLVTYDNEIETISMEIKRLEEHLNYLLRSVPGFLKREVESVYDNVVDNTSALFASHNQEAVKEKNDNQSIDIPNRDLELQNVSKSIKSDLPLEDTGVLNVTMKNTMDERNLGRDINNTRNRYMLGKIAGEDIIGVDGKLIVQKGSVITEDIVKLAEDGGVLSLLVINMVLPDMVE